MERVLGGVGNRKAAGHHIVGGDETQDRNQQQLTVPTLDQLFQQFDRAATALMTDDIPVSGKCQAQRHDADRDPRERSCIARRTVSQRWQIRQRAEVVQSHYAKNDPPRIAHHGPGIGARLQRSPDFMLA